MSQAEGWRPTAVHGHLKGRAELLQDIREFFRQRNVMEVETPLMSMAGNPDPEIQTIRTEDGACLRTSPEFALKRLLAAGSGDIFELGRVFRGGEAGRSHNPEFTMLEWYRQGFSYQQLMNEVADIVRFCGRGKFDDWPVQKLSYRQLFINHLGVDPYEADEHALSACAKNHGTDELELNHKQWLDLLISTVIQPALPKQCLTFVYDFPADQAALARIRQATPPVAERFELYLGRTELANGYQELTDAGEQAQRFEADNHQRQLRGQPVYRIDFNLVEALKHGLPDCAGVALGVDRLLMAVVGAASISDVLAFASSNA